jgi:hypothetical protein
LREKVFAIAANLRLENPRPQGVEAGIEETYY